MEHNSDGHVLIAGGGVAALEAALALRALAAGRISVELLAPDFHFWYRPLAVAEPFALGEAPRYDLSKLAADAGAALTPGTLDSVDANRQVVYSSGGAIPYSKLLIACGAVPKPAIDGAVTFRGPSDIAEIEQLLAEIEAGDVHHVTFAVPAGAVWSLPAYELALMTASWLETRGIEDVRITLATPEEEPLQVFGREASNAVGALLAEKGIAVSTGAYPAAARPGELFLVWDRIIPSDRVIALPRLFGTRIGGVPQTLDGFIPVDDHGRILGLSDVFAAGDITTFPLKQGGIAAQQADAAAETIAAELGADVDPRPFRPMLRGLLLTGGEPRFLRADLAEDGHDESRVGVEPLWWPPAKIVGRHLAPFLAGLSDTGVPAEPPPEAGVAVEVELDADALRSREQALETAIDDAHAEVDAARVAEVMVADPLVVAPEDTLGEVAEKMQDRDVGTAIVADYGRLIGILTSRDMLRALAGRVHSSEARARQWMTAEPIAVSGTTTLAAAAALMAEHGIHHLPVVEGERPVGMLSMRDVVLSMSPFAALRARIGLGF